MANLKEQDKRIENLREKVNILKKTTLCLAVRMALQINP